MDKFKNLIMSTDKMPIFIDLNNLLYRYHFVYTPDKFKTKQGLPNGFIFGLAQTLKTLNTLNYLVFICEDSKENWRKTLNEDYKANRDHSISFLDKFTEIRDLISDLPNTYTIAVEGREADDLMYSGAKVCSSLGKKCYIYSRDKDLLQSLDENISILEKITLSKKEVICYNSDEYFSKFEVEPCKLPLYRAFKGDISDNLPIPVKRLPKDLMLDLIEHLYNNASLSNYKLNKKSHEKWLKLLVENWNIYLDNYKIMKLNIVDFDILDKSKLGSYIKICEKYDLFQFRTYIQNINKDI